MNPLLKWLGNKRQIVYDLISRFPESYKDYYEPFLGSGTVFFSMTHSDNHKYYLSDKNEELIYFFRGLQECPEEVIRLISDFKFRYAKADMEERKRMYYDLRNMDRSPLFSQMSIASRAARMYCLNKTSFHGLYRVNSKGLTNMAFGYNEVPPIDIDLLNRYVDLISKVNPVLSSHDYNIIKPVKGDFVYLDPPYIEKNNKTPAVRYVKEGFDLEEQQSLFDFCYELDDRGVLFLMSNTDNELVREGLKQFRLETIETNRVFRPSVMFKSQELIIRNF